MFGKVLVHLYSRQSPTNSKWLVYNYVRAAVLHCTVQELMPVQQMLNFVFGTCNACPGFDTKGAVPVGKFPLPAQVRINRQNVYYISHPHSSWTTRRRRI